jgi:hypothetical protein
MNMIVCTGAPSFGALFCYPHLYPHRAVYQKTKKWAKISIKWDEVVRNIFLSRLHFTDIC